MHASNAVSPGLPWAWQASSAAFSSALIGGRSPPGGPPAGCAQAPEASKVNVTINTASLDSNHAERDKHLRSADFLNVDKHPQASFVSTAVKSTGEGTADITGDLTLNGVTKPVVIQARLLGEGQDPWGGYRAGFEGSTRIALKDFGITKDLGPASQEVELILSVEGIRQ